MVTDVHGGSSRRNATCVSGRSMIVPPSACDKLTPIHSNPILCSKALSTTARRPYFHTSENPNTNHWSKTDVKRFGALVLCAASGDDWVINDCCAPKLAPRKNTPAVRERIASTGEAHNSPYNGCSTFSVSQTRNISASVKSLCLSERNKRP